MITKMQVMAAVEKDPQYIQRKQEIRTQIDTIEGRIFELREQLRELHNENNFLYNHTYDRLLAEMTANDPDA